MNRYGLTLVEVLLTTAIMAVVLGALAQLQDNGARAAVQATLTAEASVLCQSELDAWLSGSNTSSALDAIEPIVGNSNWSKRITLQSSPNPKAPGLSLLTVEIYRSRYRPPIFMLSRWVATPAKRVQP